MKNCLFLLFFYLPIFLFSQSNTQTTFEKSGGLETGTYDEMISYYQQLDKDFDEVNLQTVGMTDSGYPLHLVLVSVFGGIS